MRDRRFKIAFAGLLGLGALAVLNLNYPAIAQDASSLPDAPGKDKVAAACSGCHNLGQIMSQHQSAERWTDIVTKMVNNGAPVPDADFDAIVSYLAANFGPAGAEARPAAPGSAPNRPK